MVSFYNRVYHGSPAGSDMVRSNDSFENSESVSVHSFVHDKRFLIPLNEFQLKALGWEYFLNRSECLYNGFQENWPDSVEVEIPRYGSMEKVAGILGSSLQYDSAAFFNLFTSECYLNTFNLNPFTLKAHFLPGKLRLSCHTTPVEFLEMLQKRFDNYWDKAKLRKAEELNLTPVEVVILASIVNGETWKEDEMPKIAGLYLNRLEKGMRLQADPTVVFACKQKDPDWQIMRVEREHLEVESPYNTYLNSGLPPGPIGIPNPASIEAVLDAARHDYIYMVANPDSFGYHTFSTNLEEHRLHSKKYIAWLESIMEPAGTDSITIPDCISLADSLQADSLVVMSN